MTLYDFNGIFQPISTKKVDVKIQAGIGGANLKFYESASSSSALGSESQSQYFQSANHLNVHGGVGVDVFVTDHIFVRPEFNIHYIPNLTQFGSSAVITGMVWVGYSWGDR
jgi:outer membrane protein W